jgi:hypothetical protein
LRTTSVSRVLPKGKSTQPQVVIYGGPTPSASHLASAKIVLQIYFKNLELLSLTVDVGCYRLSWNTANHISQRVVDCLFICFLKAGIPVRAGHSFKGVLPRVKIYYETSGVRRPRSLQRLESHWWWWWWFYFYILDIRLWNKGF